MEQSNLPPAEWLLARLSEPTQLEDLPPEELEKVPVERIIARLEELGIKL